MKTKLPAQRHAALEIRIPLSGISLSRAVLDLMDFYHITFSMQFPSINMPVLLFKYLRDLGLPSRTSTHWSRACCLLTLVEVYPAVRQLARMLEIDFTYPILEGRLSGVTKYPEIQLICLVVLATKLSQPFDDTPRLPESESDPTVLRLDWERWKSIMIEDAGVLKKGEEIHITEGSVFKMDAKELDEYMDWYQAMWMDDRDTKSSCHASSAFRYMLTDDQFLRIP